MITLNLNPELKPLSQTAHIDVIGSFSMRRIQLYPWTTQAIGEFTRENIQKWLEYESAWNPEPLAGDLLGDFHAVCGDLDIPWATEEAKARWEKLEPWTEPTAPDLKEILKQMKNA
jgi:hypothetical protein